MPRSINDIYNFYRYIVRKERGVFVTIPQAMANLDAGQLDCFQEYFKLYGMDGTVHDALSPFRVYYMFTSDAAGNVTYPSDYEHIVGDSYTVTGSTVNVITAVNDDEFVSALMSQLRPVSLMSPICIDRANGFQIYPSTLQIGFFTYLKRPATPVLDYTQSGRDITYVPAGSTQLEWTDAYINNIIAKALRYAGINMDEQGISQFAEMYNAETK